MMNDAISENDGMILTSEPAKSIFDDCAFGVRCWLLARLSNQVWCCMPRDLICTLLSAKLESGVVGS